MAYLTDKQKLHPDHQNHLHRTLIGAAEGIQDLLKLMRERECLLNDADRDLINVVLEVASEASLLACIYKPKES